MLLGSHRRAVGLCGEEPAILKYSAPCFPRKAEGPEISFMAVKKNLAGTPHPSTAVVLAWERLSVRTAHAEHNSFKTSCFQCDAMFSTAVLGKMLLLHCTVHLVWVLSPFSFFNKLSSPSFIPQSPKHKSRGPPGIAKLNLLHK